MAGVAIASRCANAVVPNVSTYAKAAASEEVLCVLRANMLADRGFLLPERPFIAATMVGASWNKQACDLDMCIQMVI